MPRYLDLALAMARRIAAGDPAPGTALPSIRGLAAHERTTATTAARALRELAAAGVISAEPRRTARVTPEGASAARWMLRGGHPFRLAGSDDPALSLVLAQAGRDVVSVGARGSYHGLTALWSDLADGSALHLRHDSGEYNAPFARALLAEQRPALINLWQREQGMLVASGNPRGVDAVADLTRLRSARRPSGTGTRTLMDRLLRGAGVDPDRVSGPEVELHLDVALAVATGEVDVGVGLRSSALALGLDFVPLAWEPFQIATTRAEADGFQPILRLLGDPAIRGRVEALGGYDLTGVGEILEL